VNTPAHAPVNLALLGGGARRRWARRIVAGAVVPDLAIVAALAEVVAVMFSIAAACGAGRARCGRRIARDRRSRRRGIRDALRSARSNWVPTVAFRPRSSGWRLSSGRLRVRR
jgi:hypothetical protein